ncbi:hypothetical protein [Wolbachia endosymbiont (group A) of Brachyopa scutellaris]|uniref:hypothetical protein n=1 Tax=Wolbachia endosymbiont (group A) of Brachyopa scutellaris TaxID=3066140 RepID=UPI003132AF40
MLNYSAIEYRSQLYKHCSLSPLDPSALFLSSQYLLLSSQCPDTGIQKSLLVSKQTSIESGYNVFDEIAERLDSRLE